MTNRRERATRNAQFRKQQLEQFYGPLLAIHREIRARSELRVKLQHAMDDLYRRDMIDAAGPEGVPQTRASRRSMRTSRTRILDNIVKAVGGDYLTLNAAYAIGVQFSGSRGIARGNTFNELYRQACAPSSIVGEAVGVLFNSSTIGGVSENNSHVNSQLQTHTFWGVGW